MAKKEITQEEIVEAIADMWKLLTEKQRTLVANHLEVRQYKKHQIVYAEGEIGRAHV